MNPKLTYIKTPLHHYTFKPAPIRSWIIRQCIGPGILNLFAGETDLGLGEWRNDLDVSLFDLRSSMDACDFIENYEGELFNTIILDPPYAYRKSMEFYKGNKNSRFKRLKDGISRIIEPNGRVITFGYQSVSMGKGRGFMLTEVAIFNHGGAQHDTIACVEDRIWNAQSGPF